MKKIVITILTPVVTVFFIAVPVFADGVIDSITPTSSDSGNVFIKGQTGSSGSAAGAAYHAGASHNICTISTQIKAVGSPTDAIRAIITRGTFSTSTILTDSFFDTDYPVVGMSDTGYQVRSTSYATVTYTFTPCVAVAGAYWYNIYFYRDSADTTNYYQIYNSNSSPGTRTGTGYFVVDSEFNGFNKHQFANAGIYLSLNGSENFGSIEAPAPSFGQTVINNLLGINDSNASSSLATGSAGFNAFTAIPTFLSERVPFGYLWDIRDIFVNAATSSSDFGTLSFDYSDTRISTGTRSWLPGNLVVFSTSTVTSLISPSLLAAFNSLVSASLMVGWLIYAFYRIKGQVPA